MQLVCKSKDAWIEEDSNKLQMMTDVEALISNKFQFLTNCPCVSRTLMTPYMKQAGTKIDHMGVDADNVDKNMEATRK